MIKNLFIVTLLLAGLTLQAQNRPFKKADRLYSQERFADAIPHYIKKLKEHESSSALAKLARCYFKTNQISEADSVYQVLFQRKRVRDRYLKDYAEVLMQLGQYKAAVDTLDAYMEEYPDDLFAGELRNSAIQSRDIPAYFSKVEMRPFLHNTLGDDADGVILNGQVIYSSDRPPDIALLKGKSGTTGRHYYRLFSIPLDNDPARDEPTPYSGKLNAMRGNTCYASFNGDGTEVVFNRNSKQSNRKGEYTMQIVHAQRDSGGTWGDLNILPFCTVAFNYMHPCLSAGGDTLLFASDKAGSVGGMDLFICVKENGQWGDPLPLDAVVNTPQHEGFPFLHHDGRLFFCSKGHGGFGGYDLFVCEKNSDGQWTKPVNLGRPINSPKDDVSIFIDYVHKRGILTSSRLEQMDDLFILTF